MQALVFGKLFFDELGWYGGKTLFENFAPNIVSQSSGGVQSVGSRGEKLKLQGTQ